MRIGVISDTHDRLETLSSALEYFAAAGITTVFHAGDWKSLSTVEYCALRCQQLSLTLRGVLGNNDHDIDGFLKFADQAGDQFILETGVLTIQIDGKRIDLYHGHHLPTRRKLLASTDTDVVILGHSHKPLIEYDDTKLIVNPGSTAFAIP